MNKIKREVKENYSNKTIITYIILVIIFTITISLIVLNNIISATEISNEESMTTGAAITGFFTLQNENLRDIDIENGYFFPVISVFSVLICCTGFFLISYEKKYPMKKF